MSTPSSRLIARAQRSRDRLQVALLVVLAYLPSLTAAPGKMPADTKLYLYLDPVRLTSDAPYSWDSRQFAGWVPHQTVSYLWPSGPWYSACSAIGVPDWIAHRLWIGSLMVIAGLGVRWAAKHLGIPATGALIAAMLYQLSPYVLPYVSRTSTMLLPWAGLGWLIGLTIRAATRTKWRDVAVFGLVILTVAAPNATAIMMIAPAPVLWLLHAAWGRLITWRRALITTAKLGGISLLMSAWWIAMLAVQGKHGADVLGYSETLEAVSFTSWSTEVIRGMGYWLFYVRDPIGFATTASFDYLSSGRLLAITFAVLGVSLLGLVTTRWVSRRYAVLLVFVGVVLAVGVHPIGDPSPLMSPLAHNSRSAIALAMRSSTRALPLSTLGFALGAGALVSAIGRSRLRLQLRRGAPWLVGLLAVLNLPVLWTGGFVDQNLTRDQQPPQAWLDAAAALDRAPSGYRVIQIPGSEFGAYRWGYTVDPALPGLTQKPFVSRDLLPLGSAAAMDTLYALDDRFQEGTIELAAVAPIARLFGVDTIWLPNDIAFERFRTPRPETISDLFTRTPPGLDDGLGPVVAYGAPATNVSDVPMIDEQSIVDSRIGAPLAPVELVPVLNPVRIVRAKTGTLVVAGSGDGLVDAAAAGLITGGELIRYAADLLAPGGDAGAIGTADRIIITDSNRDRAHHWRGSQDVTGFTEDGTGEADVLRFDSADQRIPVFANNTAADHTVSEQRGAVQARASAYGEPFAYRPEDRPVMAIDGDPNTAWRVADRFDATGEFLSLTSQTPISSILLRQPTDNANRWISRIQVDAAGGKQLVNLTDASRNESGQRVDLAAPSRNVTITIVATDTLPLSPEQGVDAVGFAEVDAGLGRTEELIRVPSNVTPKIGPEQPLDIVLTRLRTRATNRFRDDPEPDLSRVFVLADARQVQLTVTAALSPHASDSTLASLFDVQLTTSTAHLAGSPTTGGWAATDGNPGTGWVSPFGAVLGSRLDVLLDGPTPISSLQLQQPISDKYGSITEVRVSSTSGAITVAVPPPNAQGISTVSVDGLVGDTLGITITDTNHATTTDRRYGEPVELPVGLNEIVANGVSPRALPSMLDTGCRLDLFSIDGSPVGIRLIGSIQEMMTGAAAHVELCGDQLSTLGPGEHIVRSQRGVLTGIDVNRVVLSSVGTPKPAAPATPTVTELGNARTSRSYRVDGCPTGCWLVFGEGFNTGWTADVGGSSLGTQSKVDGGFNGWYLPPSDTSRIISLEWSGQSTLNLGLLVSGIGLLLCVALIVLDRRRTDGLDADIPVLDAPWRPLSPSTRPTPYRAGLITTVISGVAGALVIAPIWGLVCAVLAYVCCVLLRRPLLLGVGSIAISGYIALIMLHRVKASHPFAKAGWPGVFDDLHRPGLAVIVVLLSTISVGHNTQDGPHR